MTGKILSQFSLNSDFCSNVSEHRLSSNDLISKVNISKVVQKSSATCVKCIIPFSSGRVKVAHASKFLSQLNNNKYKYFQ